jgi:hypothetical protein
MTQEQEQAHLWAIYDHNDIKQEMQYRWIVEEEEEYYNQLIQENN